MNDANAPKRNHWLIAVAVIWWITIAAVGFWAIPQTIDIALRIYASFSLGASSYSTAYWGGTAMRSILAVILGAVYVAVIVGLSEYTFRYFGKAKSWKALAHVTAVEIALIMLSYLV